MELKDGFLVDFMYANSNLKNLYFDFLYNIISDHQSNVEKTFLFN